MMSEAQDDLRATADSIIEDAGRLAAVETEKRGLTPGDPRLVRLSEVAAAIARQILPKTKAESELAQEVTAGRD